MVLEATINYWAVLVAALASQALGFLWYGPLFGKTWIKLSGCTEKDMQKAKDRGMGKTYFLNFIAGLISVYVLAHFIDYLQATTMGAALQAAFWIWLGFIAPLQLGMVFWEGKPFKLYVLNVAYYLISFSIMSIILALWA